MSISDNESRHLDNKDAEWLRALPPIDWEADLTSVSRVTEMILRSLAENKVLLRKLIEAAPTDPYIWSKCEQDVVEDKIVLWDDMSKGIRIRLRMSTQPQQRLAHSHRFSFSNLVLRGKYLHWIYSPLPTFNELTRLDDVQEVMIHEDKAGDCFTIHHDTLHSTPFVERHTVSLVLRGNPVKARAPVMFKEARGRSEELERIAGVEYEPAAARPGDMFWRVGEVSESAERRSERQMSAGQLRYWLETLSEYRII